MIPRLLPLATLLCWAASGIGPAAAAPQILGLVASSGPIPLGCDAEGCHATLSAFCLQQGRPIPAPDAVYRPAHAQDVTLVGRTSSGTEIRVAAEGYVTIASTRGFTSVRAILPLASVAELGLASAAIEIGPRASLVPVAEPGDANPLDPDEIALAVGPLRAAADRFFGDADPRAKALRLADFMINALPERGRSNFDREGDPSGALLRRALAADPAASADPIAVTLAAAIHGRCRWAVAEGLDFSVRRCLEAAHDRLVLDADRDVWEAASGY